MKKRMLQLFTIMLIFSTLIASCTGSAKKADTINTTKKDSVIAISDISGCYRLIIEKDSAFMNIKQNGNMVEGELQYFPFEKDKNKGSFSGRRNNDYLEVWYSFSSEGKTSVRQSAFKIIGHSLAEGYGDVEMRNDTIVFQYPVANLQFEVNHRFEKINCP